MNQNNNQSIIQDSTMDISRISNNNNLQTVTETIDNTIIERPLPSSLNNFAIRNPGGVDLYQLEQQRKQVPAVQDVDLNMDRTIAQPRGPYQIAIKAERLALISDLNRFMKQLVDIARSRGKSFKSNDLLQAIKFIPNSRFAYYNRLIRDGVQRQRFSQDDIDFVDTVWMNDFAKTSLKNFMNAFLDPSVKSYTVTPTPSKSGIRYDAAPGERLALKLSNPGTLYFPTTMLEQDELPVNTSVAEAALRQLDEKLNQIVEQSKLDADVSPMYDNLDASSPLGKTLMSLRDNLMSQGVRYNDLIKQIDAVTTFIGARRSKYLSALSAPFKVRNARVPTLISPPSATFSIKSIVSLTTNASGNVAFVLSPYSLFASGTTTSSLGINNAATLTGVTSDANFAAVACGQNLPADFYIRYRLVSAGLRFIPFPSSNNDNGLASISTTFESITSATVGTGLPNSQQFGEFAQVENGYYKQTTTIASRNVQEHVYIPLDESFWDYSPVGTPRTGFAWAGYVTGAVASQAIARLEMVMNFEALLDNQYTDYLPSESPTADIEPKLIMSAIMKARDSEVLTPQTVQKVFEEQNVAFSPQQEIKLPVPKVIQQSNKGQYDDLASIAKVIVKEQLDKLPKQNKPSWLETIMNAVSPHLGNIISSVVNPFTNLALPFKI